MGRNTLRVKDTKSTQNRNDFVFNGVRTVAAGILVAAGAWAAAGCSGAPPAASATTEESTAALNNPTGWSLWPTHSIQVCFVTATWNDASLATWRSNAQTWLANSISAVANLSFTGFGQCGANTSNMITITVDSNRAGSIGSPGWQGSSAPSPIIFGADGLSATTGQGVVIHETMHTIGFGHEFNRSENVTAHDCYWQVEQPGNHLGTPYDHYSIMNDTYCGTWNSLSPWDIEGLRNAYGKVAALHGFMIKSDTDSGLAVNAWGGAAEGTELRLHNGCTSTNPDCTWTYLDGMLLSDSDPTLAINAWGGADEGVALLLTRACTRDNPDCTWTYKKGMFVSDTNSALAINAWGGAVHGASLLVTAACTDSNPDCTWTLPNMMIASDRDPFLNWNAWGGAAFGTYIMLHAGCSTSNTDCTWTLRNGMILSDSNASLAVNAWGGATNLAALRLHSACTSSNPDCTWQWHKGELFSDNALTLGVNALGGAAHGTQIALNSDCTATNPDCLFWSRLAKD